MPTVLEQTEYGDRVVERQRIIGIWLNAPGVCFRVFESLEDAAAAYKTGTIEGILTATKIEIESAELPAVIIHIVGMP